MKKLVKNVVEKTYRFRLFKPDGEPTDIIVAQRGESEDAARLNLPKHSEKTYDWRIESVEEDTWND